MAGTEPTLSAAPTFCAARGVYSPRENQGCCWTFGIGLAADGTCCRTDMTLLPACLTTFCMNPGMARFVGISQPS